jgi:hypothetical protein
MVMVITPFALKNTPVLSVASCVCIGRNLCSLVCWCSDRRTDDTRLRVDCLSPPNFTTTHICYAFVQQFANTSSILKVILLFLILGAAMLLSKCINGR